MTLAELLPWRESVNFPDRQSMAQAPAARLVGGGRKPGYRAGGIADAGPERAGRRDLQINRAEVSQNETVVATFDLEGH